MSYCRFSDMDFQCDLYCYDHVHGGITTHIASNRPILDRELPPPIPWESEDWDAMVERSKIVNKWLDTAEREQLSLQHAGESFSDSNHEDFLERLIYLRSLGYRFPDHVIESVKEIIKNQENGDNDGE